MSGNETDLVLVSLTPGHPGDHASLDYDRTTGIAVAELAVGNLMLPDHLTRARIERHQLSTTSADKEPVVVNGKIASRQARTTRNRQT